MNIEEIRKGAPEGAQYYYLTDMLWIKDRVTYLKKSNGKYFEFVGCELLSYETSVIEWRIKPL